MAFTTINFTEAYTVNEGGGINAITSTLIDCDGLSKSNDNAWLMYDLGEGNEIGGSSGGSALRARFEYTLTAKAANHRSSIVAWAEGVGPFDAHSEETSDGIWCRFITDGSNNLRGQIIDISGGSIGTTTGSVNLSTSTKYYVTVEFDPALGTHGRVTIDIETGSYGGTNVETITADLSAAQSAWRYFYAMGGTSDFGATNVIATFDIETMQIENFSVSDSSVIPNAAFVQDYDDYTEVDPSGDITKTSTLITTSAIDRGDEAFVWKAVPDSGVVNADFTAHFQVKIDPAHTFHVGYYAGLVDGTAATPATVDAGSDSGLFFGRACVSGTVNTRMNVVEFDAGVKSSTTGTVDLSEDWDFWMVVSFDVDGGGGNGRVVVEAKRGHPDCVRSIDSITHDLAAQHDYDKMIAFSTEGSGSLDDGDWTIQKSWWSFDASGTYLQSVATDAQFSTNQTFDTNDTISEDGIKRDIGGKSVARDGAQSRIWVLGVDTSLDDTIALYTPSDGITWVGETITSNFAARGHALCIGDGGEPVVALHKDGTTDIQIWERSSGGTWTKKATVSAGSASDIDAFGIHFDGTTYHLIYMDQGGASVAAASRNRLRHRTSTNLTSWSSATTVDAGHKDGPRGESKAMSSAIDRNGDIHVVYGLGNSSGDQKLNYVVYDESAGTWGSVEEIEDFGVSFLNNNRLKFIDLAIDTNNKPHFVGTIEADVILGASNGFVNDDDPAVFYWERTGSSWSSALVVDATDDTVQANYNPTLHLNNGTTAIVHWGSQTTSGGELKRAERSGGGWTRTRVGLVDQFGTSAANYEADAAHYARTNGGYLVTGDFLVLRGSIIMIQSTATVWGDGTTLMESVPTFSQVLQVKGRASVDTDVEFSQDITVNRAYPLGTTDDPTFDADVTNVNYDRNRGDTREPVFENGLGYTLVPTGGGGDTHYIQVTENRLSFRGSARQLVQTEISDDLTFSQSISLTLGKTVEEDIEFGQDLEVQRIKLLTASGDVLIDDTVLMNKVLNLGVSTDIAFSQQGIPIRDWNAYSTHFDPGWGSEDSTTQVVFLHPSSLPTTSVTMMRPDFGDVREDRRRSGAIRRNRTGQPRTFKTPVYSTFVLTWTGIPRFVAEEFRTRMVSYMGDKLRYQDHNGVFQEVIIADEALIRNQGNHEHVTLSITLAKVERIDVAPTTAG